MIQERVHFHRQHLSQNPILQHQIVPQRKNEDVELVKATMALLAVLHRISRLLDSHCIPFLVSHLHDVQFPVLGPYNAAPSLFFPFQQRQTHIVDMRVLHREHICQNGVIGLAVHQLSCSGQDFGRIAALLDHESVVVEIGTNDALDFRRKHRKPFFQRAKKMGAFRNLLVAKGHPKRSATMEA